MYEQPAVDLALKKEKKGNVREIFSERKPAFVSRNTYELYPN